MVMKEARLNPVARANAVPTKQVQVAEIGGGYGLVAVTLEPAITDDADPSLAIVLNLIGGRKSDLVPMVPVKLVLGELVRVPLTRVRELLEEALKPAVEPS